jgi:hypothetical protein
MKDHRRIIRILAVSACLPLLLSSVAAAEQMKLDSTIMRDGVVRKPNEMAGTLKNFSDAYKANQKPKIAIFLNRTLSDDVREWKTNQRAVITGNGSVTMSSETPLRYREETVKGPMAAYEQQQNTVTEARQAPAETYVWSFEDGFMQPFLRAGATLVDRATIMRILSQKVDQGSQNDPIEMKKTEMNALTSFTDIYIELLITRHPSAPTGYEFRAVAKEIKTGRIVGSATSLNWDTDTARPKKVIATEKGYRIIDDPEMPKVQNVSSDLAVDLMNSMISVWNNR